MFALRVSLPCIDENMRIQMYPLPRRALCHHPGASYGIGDRRQKRPIERGRGRSTWARVARPQPCDIKHILRILCYVLCATILPS